MHHGGMKKRCPDSRFISLAYLDGYRFVYDGKAHTHEGAVANIIPHAGSRVEGGFWKIRDTDLLKLDRYEDFPRAYKRLGDFCVTNKEGKKYEGIIAYLRSGEKEGEPHDGYRAVVLQGARDCGLSEEYIETHIALIA